MHPARIFALSALAAIAVAACGDSKVSNTFQPSGSAGSGASSTGKGGSTGKAGSSNGTSGTGGKGGSESAEGGSDSAGGTGGSGIDIQGGGGFNPGGECPDDGTADKDGDGWTVEEGDCNDCDKNVNPGAIDVVNYELDADGKPTDKPLPDDKQIDEDCDMKVALPGDKTSCDGGLGPVMNDPFDAARAMGLCNVNVEENPADPKQRKWGVIDAKVSDIAGAPLSGKSKQDSKLQALSFGLLPDFGSFSKAREGERLFALSSGLARAEGQPGFDQDQVCGFSKDYSSQFPPGFPKQGSCGTTGEPHDGIALDLKIRVPTNAKQMKFNFRFFSCEYPNFVCSVYNDVFAVLMSPSPLPAGDPMADPQNASANIAFEDAKGKKNVIGVNNQSFFTACNPGPDGYDNCKGDKELAGSGFVGHGGSAWLGSQVPVPSGGIIFLRFAIWDSSDGILDSSAVVDNFSWSAEEGTGVTTKVDPPIN